jgi:ribulose-5-phosphate 4-epimerase/fuculose-1-phosphate aldolase
MTDLKQQIVHAAKIIVRQGLACDPFGNISARLSTSNDFLINPEGVVFNQLKVTDIVMVNVDAGLINHACKPHPGVVIHREIYRLYPEIKAIVHTHSEAATIFSLLGCTIKPFTQLGASLFMDQGLYSGFSGPVRSNSEGLEIAQALAGKAIVIAKNHGIFAANHNLPAALWDMLIADIAAQTHVAATQLGIAAPPSMREEDYLKSKLEVRTKQYDLMWRSLVNDLAKG